ncbi:MAG: IS3 family transposase [Oligoflexales bacterium]
MLYEACDAGCCRSESCDALGVHSRTLRRWERDQNGDMRRGPLKAPGNKLSKAERDQIIQVAVSKEYRDKPVAQIVPSFADKGFYVASESSFHRVLRAARLNAHRGRSKKPQKHMKAAPLVAIKPNQIYSWDITYLKSSIKGKFFYLYCFMDVYSRKIVGYKIHETESAEYASLLLREIYNKEEIQQDQVTLHSDNASPMKGATMLATMQSLGVMPSFSRPAVSNDNPYSESLFKTTKYCPLYPTKPFESVEQAMKWMKIFVNWYNEEHLHSGISYVTPGSKHRGEDKVILNKRREVYAKAKENRPERWSNKVREWSFITEVYLNPLKDKKQSDKQMAA